MVDVKAISTWSDTSVVFVYLRMCIYNILCFPNVVHPKRVPIANPTWYPRATVSDINRNVAENLRYCGPYLVSDTSILDKVVALVTSIIAKKHPCQQEYGADEVDQEALDELSEFDWVVIDTALDVISGLATALGPNFVRLWPVFEKTVYRYAGSSESIERANAVGVLAEVISGMAGAVTPYTGTLLRLLARRLTDEDSQTKSNAVYAIGQLCEKSNANEDITKAYPTILEKLESCMHNPESNLPDNASGCISRMILKHRDHVPVADVLPALVDILPLKNDFEENSPVYRMICQMCRYFAGSLLLNHFFLCLF